MQIDGLDQVDNQILEVIKDHARLSYSEIGETIGISRVTVKNRMEEMEKAGVIRGYRTIVAPENVPESVSFYLDLECDPEKIDEVLNRLAQDAVIRQLYLVSGNCRVHAVGLAPNRNTLQVYTNQLFHSQPGVRRMSYSTVLATLKDADAGIEYEER